MLRPILDYAATRGVNTSALLAELGIPESALRDPDHRIPDVLHGRVWSETSTRSRDPQFGLHVAEHAPLGSYDALDYAIRFSPTLRDAFCRMARFHRLLCDSLTTTVEVEAGRAIVHRTGPAHNDQAAECFFAYLVLRARLLAGDDVPLREVRFRHRAPADTAPHARIFRCPVKFASPVEEMVFDPREFVRDLHVATPGLVDVLDRHMKALLKRLPTGDSVLDRVREAVSRTLRDSQRPSLRETAAALKASPRTVQRWLEEREVTHRDIVDGVRRELAEHLLEDEDRSITEVAFLLGFADVGGFERRFKRWTGQTPSGARARALASKPDHGPTAAPGEPRRKGLSRSAD